MAHNDINELKSPHRTVLMFGLGGGLLLVILQFILNTDVLILPFRKLLSFLMLPIISAIPILAIKIHRDKDLGGYISYGRGVRTGSLTAFIFSIVVTVAATIHGLSKKMTLLDKWIFPLVCIMVFLTVFIIGFVISLIAARALKKEREEEKIIEVE